MARVSIESLEKRYSPKAAPAGLKLVKATTTPAGVTINRYARDGKVRTGSFAD